MSSLLRNILDKVEQFLILVSLSKGRSMKVTEKIQMKITGMKEGTTFKYQHLGIDQSEYSAAAKAIERLIKKGIVKRVSTGVFYKPKQSAFGELRPREEELL